LAQSPIDAPRPLGSKTPFSLRGRATAEYGSERLGVSDVTGTGIGRVTDDEALCPSDDVGESPEPGRRTADRTLYSSISRAAVSNRYRQVTLCFDDGRCAYVQAPEYRLNVAISSGVMRLVDQVVNRPPFVPRHHGTGPALEGRCFPGALVSELGQSVVVFLAMVSSDYQHPMRVPPAALTEQCQRIDAGRW
jgi:hypothetical protein